MGEMVTYRGGSGTGEGYLAIPPTGAASPAVIVIQDWWGLVPHIRSVVDRFAEAGFVALAPDLRHGEPAGEPGGPRRLLDGPQMDETAQTIAAAADHLAGRAEVTGKVGCAGFSAGASLALWAANFSERIVATAAFYPLLPWDGMRTEWTGWAGKDALVHCAEADGSSADQGVQTVRRAIENAGGVCQLHDYPGTAHAFFDEDRPERFDQRAATSAWARTLELFRAKLG
ncbi:dienelactone hydrolase family protein [Micromonospora sp. HNM0581]|uniref:dienelactone hydrolase family protein n=1 Tax=Micromonospora sp. HNM0581 TaxID=2716341 RepID=UPI00146A5FC2|nr:dienelactone hydrolase family protein [Micromonospora sp. HNM0581]NLU79366.1 dienelactone hydrolase family protein [Micromonospora sp. HNM0581]